jgi:hypothetical protein
MISALELIIKDTSGTFATDTKIAALNSQVELMKLKLDLESRGA